MSAEDPRRAVEELLAMAAHDLRAPLRQLGLRLALLRRKHAAELPSAVATDLEAAQEEARQLQGLLENMLSWAAGTPDQSPQAWSLEQLVDAALSQLGAEDVQSRIAVDQGLPTVLGRRAALLRIISNLLRNVLVHGGDSVRVRVQPAQAGSLAGLDIRDDGPGIPAALQERIFSPFERGASRAAGTGLGLAICRRLIEEEGGQISLSSEEGQGACFRVLFPAVA
ncbi:MAG: sensor histidine kinase [Oceanococcaceae bacterium]